MKHVVLIGDSTLDNVVWVDNKEDSVPFLLQKTLPGVTITNYAADGFTTHDTLHGAYPGISFRARECANDPFPTFDRVFQPLVHIRQLHAEKPVTHVVLSVGGNDIREILGHMTELPQRVAEFRQNYPKILSSLLEITPNVIIMLQYRPSIDQDGIYGVYRAMASLPISDSLSTKVIPKKAGKPVTADLSAGILILNALMEEIYPLVFRLAEKHGIPIVDLPNTFDIFDSDLYKCQIEPSAKGGRIITRLLSHVIENHMGGHVGEHVGVAFYDGIGELRRRVRGVGEWWIGESREAMVNAVVKGLLGKEDEDDGMRVKVEQLKEMGFGENDTELRRVLGIDGTLETAIAALVSKI